MREPETAQDHSDSSSSPPSTGRLSRWGLALAPLILLALVVAGIYALQPLQLLRGGEFPPIEELTITQVRLPEQGQIRLHVVNGGADPVTIAQVMVDEAYWDFSMKTGSGSTAAASLADLSPAARADALATRRTIPRLGSAVITIPYHWVHGEAHEVTLISSNGPTFSEQIEVAVESAEPSLAHLGLFTLLGLLVGVIPVCLGLAWFPLIRQLREGTLNALLAFTVGLLAFLLVDTIIEALEISETLPAVYEGPALLILGVGAAVLLLTGLGRWLESRTSDTSGRPMILAGLIALAIGLHNLGEGLAIGTAFNLAAISLGSTLIVGFTIHNITEGLAIIAPIGRSRVRWWHLVALGAIAGVPTIFGGWLGGFAYSPTLSVLFLAFGAGAVLQVILDIARQLGGQVGWTRLVASPAVVGGLLAGYLVMYGTGLLVSA